MIRLHIHLRSFDVEPSVKVVKTSETLFGRECEETLKVGGGKLKSSCASDGDFEDARMDGSIQRC